MRPRKLNIVGQKFGKLTVTSLSHYGKNSIAYWHCECECGNKAIVSTSSLKRNDGNQTISCGCSRRTSKYYFPRLYNIWNKMKGRCYNANDQKYYRYGGRGITVYEPWRNSFEVFKEWALANGYTDNLTIDRIDNNGDYCPSNCQWVPRNENAQKTCRNSLNADTAKSLKADYNQGFKITELSKKYGVSYNCARKCAKNITWRNIKC